MHRHGGADEGADEGADGDAYGGADEGAATALPGLTEEVSVEIDRHGVPTVTAATRQDAVRVLGALVGAERAFQLDLLRRTAQGRLAELLGTPAIGSDHEYRALELPRTARVAYGALPPAQSALLDAFAQGINSTLRAHRPLEAELLGYDIEAWHPADSVLLLHMLMWRMSDDGSRALTLDGLTHALPARVAAFFAQSGDMCEIDAAGRRCEGTRADIPLTELRHLIAEYRAEDRPVRGIVDSALAAPGSNMVAVSGRLTGDGRAILANDLHLDLAMPATWFKCRLRWPGTDARGLLVPGVPILLVGQTPHLAWGVTRLAADTVQMVALEVSTDGACYRAEDGWRPFGRRVEVIGVRGAPSQELHVMSTIWGPVCGRRLRGRPVVRRWAGAQPTGTDLTFFEMTQATTVEDAIAVANRAGGPTLNVGLAGGDGRVAWTVSGRFPRGGHRPGAIVPSPGDQPWPAFIAPAQLPHVIDPPTGFVVNANNRSPEHRPLPGNYFNASRADRISRLVGTGTTWHETDLLAMQYDADAGFYEFYRDLALAPALAAARGSAAIRRDAENARAAVRRWDGTASAGAIGLAVLVLWRELLRDALLCAALARCVRADPEFRYALHNHERPLRTLLELADPALAPPPYRGFAEFLTVELALAAVRLTRLTGLADLTELRWGRLNTSAIRHPLSARFPRLSESLDLPEVPLPGTPESVCASWPAFGASVRWVISPTAPQDGSSAVPGGQSGIPGNPTYRDQWAAWLCGARLPVTGAAAARSRYRAAPPTETS